MIGIGKGVRGLGAGVRGRVYDYGTLYFLDKVHFSRRRPPSRRVPPLFCDRPQARRHTPVTRVMRFFVGFGLLFLYQDGTQQRHVFCCLRTLSIPQCFLFFVFAPLLSVAQFIAGAVEQRVFDTLLAKHPGLSSVGSTVVRSANLYIGSLTIVDWLRFVGLQQ